MRNKKIGNATMEYDEAGNVIKSYFEPTMKVVVSEELLKTLKQIPCSNNEAILKQNAETAFASWFSKMNEIELADREEYAVTSKVTTCEKYQSGNVKKCIIAFSFEKLQTT